MDAAPEHKQSQYAHGHGGWQHQSRPVLPTLPASLLSQMAPAQNFGPPHRSEIFLRQYARSSLEAAAASSVADLSPAANPGDGTGCNSSALTPRESLPSFQELCSRSEAPPLSSSTRSPISVAPHSDSRTRLPARIGLAKQPRPRKPKVYSDAFHSIHCHVCGRSSKTQKVAICSNLKFGTCRKIICEYCFDRNGWPFESDASRDLQGWICTHCRSNCPVAARCHIYKRINIKRKFKSQAAGGTSTGGLPRLQD